MSQAPAGADLDELNVAARKVLLDALTALKDHRDALTVVGAQAVYLRTQEAEIRSAAYTSDGDISIDPSARRPAPAGAGHARGGLLTSRKPVRPVGAP